MRERLSEAFFVLRWLLVGLFVVWGHTTVESLNVAADRTDERLMRCFTDVEEITRKVHAATRDRDRAMVMAVKEQKLRASAWAESGERGFALVRAESQVAFLLNENGNLKAALAASEAAAAPAAAPSVHTASVAAERPARRRARHVVPRRKIEPRRPPEVPKTLHEMFFGF